MQIGPIISIVATDCPPECESKFNEWYNNVHIPMFLKFKGIKEVTRYKLATEAAGHPKYLAIYEFENQDAFEAFKTCPELAAAREERDETWPEKKWEVKYAVQYEPVKSWKR